MRSGLLPSILLHLAIFLVCYIGLPKLKKDLNQEYAFVTEVVNISEITNVKIRKSFKEKPPREAEKKIAPKSVVQEPKDAVKPETVKHEKTKDEKVEQIQ